MSNAIKSAAKLLFISDVHLGGFGETRDETLERSLIHLIDFCEREGYKMYILGDLFDYWMEYPNYTPSLGSDLLDRFQSYNSATGETLFITGNHDNWTNGHFKDLGFDLEENYRILNINGTNIFLMHGDGVEDPYLKLKRPIFHRILRHSAITKIYQALLPAKRGLEVMKWFSKWMRSREQSGLEDIRLNSWTKTKLKSSKTDVIICGHDHTPRILTYDFGTFINLGTFYEHRTVATYNNGDFSLVVWDETTKQLQPFYPGN